jgi:hypothetical protein
MAIDGLLADIQLSGTVIRGLVKQGPYCLLGYLGVPDGHWAAAAEELGFDCHGGITFRGEGDGEMLPAGWYWYGWDYGHAFDRIVLSPEMRQRMPNDFQALIANRGGKSWTLEEVKEELLDSAVRLWQQLANTERAGIQAGLVQDTQETAGLYVWTPNPA